MYYLNSRYYDQVTGRFISPDVPEVTTVTPMALTDKNLYAYCDNNPVMRRDDGGEFWLVQVGIGAAVGFIGGIIDQALSGNWSSNAWIITAVSTVEGATTALVGPVAGALISGVAGAIDSAITGNDKDQIMANALINVGTSLLGSGAQLAVGRALAGEFIDTASKTQLKKFANSLGYTGRNFKTSSSWTGRAMFDASKKFMNQTTAQLTGQSVSFIGSRAWNALSQW